MNTAHQAGLKARETPPTKPKNQPPSQRQADGQNKIMATQGAPEDVEAVRRVLQIYIDGTVEKDAEKLRSIFHDTAVMNGVIGGPSAKPMLGGPEPFFESIGGVTHR